MENNDRSVLIEEVIKFALNKYHGQYGAIVGSFNEVMDGEVPRGKGVGIQFADGSQYKITIERIE